MNHIAQKNNGYRLYLPSFMVWGAAILFLSTSIYADTGEVASPVSISGEQQSLPTPEWLIIDGTRNISYSMVLTLVKNNIPCTVVVRPADLMYADSRLPKSPLIHVVQYDYTVAKTTPEMAHIGAGAKYLFLDPEYDTYKDWHTIVPIITRNALKIAQLQDLTVFYPARIYVFNNQEVITDQTSYNPITSQGLTLMKIEYMLKRAVEKNNCRVRRIRVSYAFGPAVFEYLLSSSFKDIPTLGRLTWLFRIDKPHQFCYTPDIARIALKLSTYEPQKSEITVHFSGYTYESVEEFGNAICQVAGTTLKPRVVSEFQLSLVCFFESNAQRGSDLSAYFKQPAYLEDSVDLLQKLDFTPTPPEQAFKQTLDWFKGHDAPTRGRHHHRRHPLHDLDHIHREPLPRDRSHKGEK